MTIGSAGIFLDCEMKSQLALDPDWSAIQQVGAEAVVSKRIHTGSYKEGVAFDWHTQHNLARFIDVNLEDNVALDSFHHRVVGVLRQRFVFDQPLHYSASNADLWALSLFGSNL
jgi:hypothetical protein